MDTVSSLTIESSLQALKITIMPILPRQPQESELRWPVGTHGQQRHCRHVNSVERESEAPLHVHRQAPPHRPRFCLWCLRFSCQITNCTYVVVSTARRGYDHSFSCPRRSSGWLICVRLRVPLLLVLSSCRGAWCIYLYSVSVCWYRCSVVELLNSLLTC